ncbi:MAG: DUF2851 family protein [Deltaproteobacteria bacterium]|nr:DUF2851 family protein [Deltaproteobacteria bacterium]
MSQSRHERPRGPKGDLADPKLKPEPDNLSRKALTETLSSLSEAVVQALWAHQLWNGRNLSTRDGRSLEVLAPGWLNRGAGPDFKEARIRLGGEEHWGDIEIHVREQDWWAHRHDRDPAYDRVILHVVLIPGEKNALHPIGGELITVMEAARFLPSNLAALTGDAESLLQSYDQLPGRCGLTVLRSGEEAARALLTQASDTRARNKAELLAPRLKEQEPESVLFETLFHYLGYRPQSDLFSTLARRYTLKDLAPLLELPPAKSRTLILARWFGSLGLLETPPSPQAGPEAFEEHALLRQAWEALGHSALPQGVNRQASRPSNSPERRLVGMFHHLQVLGAQGFMKGWLTFLYRLDRLRDTNEFRSSAVTALDRLFEIPAEEPWLRRFTYASLPAEKGARLIGRERVLMLLVNAILPFFLAWARMQGDRELEKLLYRLYVVLPPEAPNQRTRFMHRRLLALCPLQDSLRLQQGLLQIHQDFCLSYQEGCHQCRLPDLLKSPHPSPSNTP